MISGGNAGIGLGFARGIARAGGDVVIWGRREEKNAEAAATLAEFDGRVFTQAVDVSDEARVVAAMAEVVEEMGRVDGVIANAGLMSQRAHLRGDVERRVARPARGEPARLVLHDARGRAAHEASVRRRGSGWVAAVLREPVGAHRQPRDGALQRVEGRDGRDVARDRGRGRALRHPQQRGVPGLHLERDGRPPRRPPGGAALHAVQPDAARRYARPTSRGSASTS